MLLSSLNVWLFWMSFSCDPRKIEELGLNNGPAFEPSYTLAKDVFIKPRFCFQNRGRNDMPPCIEPNWGKPFWWYGAQVGPREKGYRIASLRQFSSLNVSIAVLGDRKHPQAKTKHRNSLQADMLVFGQISGAAYQCQVFRSALLGRSGAVFGKDALS